MPPPPAANRIDLQLHHLALRMSADSGFKRRLHHACESPNSGAITVPLITK